MSPKRQSTSRQIDNSEPVLIAQASSWTGFLTFLKKKRGKVFLHNFGVNPQQDTVSKSRSLQYKQACREKLKTYKTAVAETEI
jgi:hypothetical protein